MINDLCSTQTKAQINFKIPVSAINSSLTHEICFSLPALENIDALNQTFSGKLRPKSDPHNLGTQQKLVEWRHIVQPHAAIIYYHSVTRYSNETDK